MTGQDASWRLSPCRTERLSTSIPGLTLRQLTAGNAPAYFALLDRNRGHLSRYGDYQDEALATLKWVSEDLARKVPDRFGIWLNHSLIGRVDLVHAAPPQYGIGYWIGRESTGYGYATAACRAIIQHGRCTHDATDVFAGVTHGNKASIGVLRHLGFRPITVLETYTRFRLQLVESPAVSQVSLRMQ